MPLPDAILDPIADDIARAGWSVTADFLPAPTITQLANEARQLWRTGELHTSGVGQGPGHAVNPDIRGDVTLWLEEPNLTDSQRATLTSLEQLRLSVNRALQLGLFDFEGHLALYPPGKFYRRHIDRFRNDNRRTLSSILYLNPDWTEEDGGQLRIYTDADQPVDVIPQGGTLVTFLSGRFWHEVLPARRERISIAGWFRTRPEGLP